MMTEAQKALLPIIRRRLEKASKIRKSLDRETQAVFDILEEYYPAGIIDTPTAAENADTLEDSITCHISYGEYSIDAILRDIENFTNNHQPDVFTPDLPRPEFPRAVDATWEENKDVSESKDSD